MRAGVSTACLYPSLLEDSFKLLAEHNVKVTEIFVNTDCELRDPYLSQMLDIQKEYNIDVVSIHPYTCSLEPMMFFTNYPRRIDDMLDYYKNFFEYMKKFGAKYFIFHGNKSSINSFNDEVYFERFAYMQETAYKYGVTVLHENVFRETSGDLAFYKRMADFIGDKAQFTLDTKQAHRMNSDPIEFVRTLGSHIKHVHFSDFGKDGDCLKFGLGEYDNFMLFNELKKVGYNGDIILELYRHNFNNEIDLTENYDSLKNYLFENNFNQ